MKVLVLGSGGREHAMAWRLSRDSDVREVLSAPGNPGLAGVGRCLPVDLLDPAAVLQLVEKERVDLTVVGPEAALERGLANLFRKAGRPIVGPGRLGAALECSKVFAKGFMERHGVPTARFVVSDRPDEAIEAVSGSRFGFPVVVKVDGLAGGKGVVVAMDRKEAESAVHAAMQDRRFGGAGSRLVIEECLVGPEVSFFVLSDGQRAQPLATAQDHKRLGDGDQGPNTGGMGAFAPSPLVDDALSAEVMRRVVAPVLDGMAREGEPYAGFLYVSLMLTADGPKVIEFNVRFGDPEAQVVMPLLEGRFAKTLLASATGMLDGVSVEAGPDRLVGVVLASAGYPERADPGRVISGLDAAESRSDTLVFHAGTRAQGGQIVTAGGRVLTIVGRGGSYREAMTAAYRAVGDISFPGMQFRRDIGRKALSADGPAASDRPDPGA